MAASSSTALASFRQVTTTLYAPEIYRYYGDWNTSITVQNAGPVFTEAIITYRWFNNNTWVVDTDRAWIQPGASRTFDQQYNTNLPRGFDGVAEITADQPLAAMVTQVLDSYDLFGRSAYDTFAFGSAPDPQTNDQLNMPLFFYEHGGLNSYVQMMNIGQSNATAEVRYTSIESCYQSWNESQSIGAGQRVTFFLPAINGLPSNYEGSAKIESLDWWSSYPPPPEDMPEIALW